MAEHVEQSLHRSIRRRLAARAVNAAGLSDRDLDVGCTLPRKFQECILDAALEYPRVSVATILPARRRGGTEGNAPA